MQKHTFREGLVWIGEREPGEAENAKLLQVLDHLDQPSWTAALEQFLKDNPQSPWAASLHYDYASFCRRTGRTTKALKHFEAAWALTKNDTSPQGQRLGGTVLANWTDLLSSLGRSDELKVLIAAGDQWPFVNPHDRDKFQGAKNSYLMMQEHPEVAYRCGTFALKAVGGVMQPGNLALEHLVEAASPTSGFNMAGLVDLAKEYGLNMVAVRRTAGQELIVPSVVHWRQDHYAAILKQTNDLYLVSDPTFGKEKWLPGEVINEEASGEFLIPASLETNGWNRTSAWQELARNEAGTIHGMGLPNNIKDGNDKCCVRLFNGQVSCAHCGGMPIWWVSEPYVNVWLADEPISYMTSRGKPFPFQVTYKQRDTRESTSDYVVSTAGWNNSWASYAVLEANRPYQAPTVSNSDATFYLPNGGEVDFSPGQNYDTETRLMLQQQSGGVVQGYDYGNNGLSLLHADGSQDIYGLVITIPEPYGDDQEAELLLTRHIDVNGDTTWYEYDNVNFSAYVLTYVVDPDGRTNTLTYTANNLLTSVTNAYGLSANFKYSSSGNLTNILDAQGLSSSITYDTNGYPTSLITPYGKTAFSIFANSTVAVTNGIEGNFGGEDLIDRAVQVTDPFGANYLYMYRNDCSSASPVDMPTTYSSSNIPTNTPLGTLDDGGSSTNALAGVCFRNSFYWGPRQFAGLSTTNMNSFVANDYLRGRMQHWLEDTNQLYLTGYLSTEQDPTPDGSTPGLMTFYDYQGKQAGYNFSAGTTALPSVRAWRLPDGETHYEYLQFDYFGNILNDINTYTLASGGLGTRTNQFVYANNTYTAVIGTWTGSSIINTETISYTIPDLLTQVISPDGNPIWSYGGFDTVTWTNFFNTGDQTNGTTLTAYRVLPDYATNGLGQVTTSTYSAGGNQVTFYDMYPGTAEYPNYNYGTPIAWSFPGYSKVTSTTSVAGLTTTNLYNANGFLKETIDLQIGKTNSFGYTINGLVGTVTNELGLNLAGTWDNLLRLTGIQYPDGTYVSNVFTKLDLTARRDRLGNWTYYGYDNVRHLTSITNANNAVTMFDWCGCSALTAVIDPYTNTTSFSYDNQGNLTTVDFPDTSTLNYQYNLAHWLTTSSDGASRTLQYGYNNQGLVTIISNAFGTVQGIAYDIRDRPAIVTDANAVTVTNYYDPLDHVVTRTWQDGMSENYGYSAQGLAFYTNREMEVTYYGRDVSGRLITVTNANGEVVQAGYNPANAITSLVDGLNHTNVWQYNVNGWLTNKIDAMGNSVLQLAYNADGWITNRWTPAMGNAAYNHDSLGNLLGIIYPNSTIAYAYDAANRLTNMVDNAGTTTFSYTQIGQLQSEDGPWPNDSVNYSYNQQLRTGLALAQPVGSWTQSYGYDAMWRMTNVVSAAGTFSYKYAFQPASSLISQLTLPNGGVIADNYDGLARLRSTAMSNSSAVTLDSESYIYDPNSYRTQQVFTAGNYMNYAYDKIGQLVGAHGLESSPVTNRWQEQFGYSYDKADNLLARTNRDLLENFGYSADNELTNANLSGGMTLSGSASGAVTNMSAKFTAVFYPGTPQQEQFSFGLDPVDLYKDSTFATYVDAHRVFFNGAFTNIPDYYAISSGQSAAATLTYSLIYQSTSSKATNNFSIPTEYLGAYLYDQNGNLTNDMLHTYSYDCENELTNVAVPGQWQSSFVYDGLGRRRIEYDSKWNGSNWTPTNVIEIIYDGNAILQERDGHNNVLTTYTRGADIGGDFQTAGGIGGLLARTDPNGSTFYHADGSGNVMALMNTSQNLVAQYLYNPFGQIEGEWGPYAGINEMQFSSMPIHALSGLSLYSFRAYNPNLQRWLNQDPIQEAGGINMYRFAANNPMFWIDPFGLDPWGHHLVPQSIWRNLSKRVQDIWNDPKNRLDAKGYNKHNAKNYGPKGGPKVKCKDYSRAVNDELDDYLDEKGVDSPEDLSDQELQDFADKIRNTPDGDIGNYNAGVAEEIAESEAAASEAATAAEAAEALTVAAEVDEAIVTTGVIVK